MLQDVLQQEAYNLAEFTRDFPVIYENIDKSCEKLVEIGFYLNDQVIAYTYYPAFGWILISVHQSLAMSALRFATRDYDEGLMLLRMACEQARDLCVLVRNPLLFYLWKRYKTNRASLDKQDWTKFRKEFKFDLNIESGRNSKWVYDHTSEVGVHGGGILTSHYLNLPASESNMQLKVLLMGLMSLPALSRDCLQPFFQEHAGLIEKKFKVPFDDFVLDLDLRYTTVFSRLVIASQELDKVLDETPS